MNIIKQFRAMLALEKSPLSIDELQFVETLPDIVLPDGVVSAAPRTYTNEILEQHRSAIKGSRAGFFFLSVELYTMSLRHAYLYATIAVLAGHRECLRWWDTLKPMLHQSERYYLETIGRKWYNAHKPEFERTKREHLQACESFGWLSSAERNNW